MIVFDLDGTLALNEHRQHYVERPVGEKNWRAFFIACDLDNPIKKCPYRNATRRL